MWFTLSKKPSLPKEEEYRIVQAIRHAESQCTAELRVHLGGKPKESPLQEATRLFHKLGMQKTAARNGVLIYVSLASRQFAIIGDEGIHKHVQENFWQDVKTEMQVLFQKEQVADAIIHGIQRAGEQLMIHFPATGHNPNELTDEISRG
ncbi:MAG: TPM domain-containing protein [Bacteroidetes bacterium]|nr:TPM domain-containing protein [Bacteroidota bacterium]